jgi:hypothetical protein
MENAIEESKLILRRAREKGVVLRLIGGLAVRQHCVDLSFCEREHEDIDFVGLSHQSSTIIDTIEEFGYQEDTSFTMTSGGTHLLFKKPDSDADVDVFLDKLQMEHEIDLRERLNIEENTISVSDLLVCKLIIENLNEKDYHDIIAIVKDNPLSHEDTPHTINIDYIAALCSQNWGLSQDLLTSISSCLDFMKTYHFEEAVSQEIRRKFGEIREAIEDHPKSFRWTLRSHLGKRLAWRSEVELENS